MSSDKIYFDHKNEAFKFELTIRKFNVIEISNMKGTTRQNQCIDQSWHRKISDSD